MNQPLAKPRDRVIVDILECDILLEEERSSDILPNHKEGEISLADQPYDLAPQEPVENVSVLPVSGSSKPRRSHRERHPPQK